MKTKVMTIAELVALYPEWQSIIEAARKLDSTFARANVLYHIKRAMMQHHKESTEGT